MSTKHIDLSALAGSGGPNLRHGIRGEHGPGGGRGPHGDHVSGGHGPGGAHAPGEHAPGERAAVPMPPVKWKTRVLLPGAILAVTAGLLLYAARETLVQARDVRVVPVVVKSAEPQGARSVPATDRNDPQNAQSTRKEENSAASRAASDHAAHGAPSVSEIGAAAGAAAGAGVPAAGGAVTAQAPGWVEAAPFAYAAAALTDGTVREVLVLEGERVSKGQVVARLVDDDARIALARAEAEAEMKAAEVLAAEAAVKEAQRNWDNPVELQRKLDTADAMLKEKRAMLAHWPDELAAAEARAVELRAELERLEGLGRSAIAEIELIRAKQQYEAQRAMTEVTRAHREVLAAEILGLEAELRAAQENLRLRIPETRALEEAKAKVQQAKAAAAAAAAMRDEARLRLERTEVRSPVDGVVMTRLVEPGSKLMLVMDGERSSQVVRIYDPNQLQVRVDVPLGDAAAVGVGHAAEIVVNVLPDKVFRGRVTRVVHQADIQKNTLQVKVAIESPTPEIKPEMLARVRFLSPGAGGGGGSGGPAGGQRVFAPDALIVKHGKEHAQTWVVDNATGTAKLVTVSLGTARIGNWVEVREGLRAGDRLIADTDGLREGMKVRVVGEAEM